MWKIWFPFSPFYIKLMDPVGILLIFMWFPQGFDRLPYRLNIQAFWSGYKALVLIFQTFFSNPCSSIIFKSSVDAMQSTCLFLRCINLDTVYCWVQLSNSNLLLQSRWQLARCHEKRLTMKIHLSLRKNQLSHNASVRELSLSKSNFSSCLTL